LKQRYPSAQERWIVGTTTGRYRMHRKASSVFKRNALDGTVKVNKGAWLLEIVPQAKFKAR